MDLEARSAAVLCDHSSLFEQEEAVWGLIGRLIPDHRHLFRVSAIRNCGHDQSAACFEVNVSEGLVHIQGTSGSPHSRHQCLSWYKARGIMGLFTQPCTTLFTRRHAAAWVPAMPSTVLYSMAFLFLTESISACRYRDGCRPALVSQVCLPLVCLLERHWGPPHRQHLPYTLLPGSTGATGQHAQGSQRALALLPECSHPQVWPVHAPLACLASVARPAYPPSCVCSI